MNRLTTVGALGALFVLVGCGAADTTTTNAPATDAPATAPPPTAVPTADASLISTGYMTAYNALSAAYNVDVAKQNRNAIGSQQLTDAVNQEAADRATFDAAIQALDTTGLPAVTSDITAVVAADANLESAESTLALNSGNLSNFNAEFSIVQTAIGSFSAANTTAASALGLSITAG
jgi:hypothetical protein